MPVASSRRVLVGTLGYQFLRDYSLGPKLLPDLQALEWPPGVDVEEMNWGPVAIVFHFEALETPYDRVVILTASQRGRPIGTLTLYRWGGTLPPQEEIQDRVSEAVTGVISLDNLLVIGEHFRIWPDEVLIVDVEPGIEEAGDIFTPPVESLVPTVISTVKQVALNDLDALPPLQELKGETIRLAADVTKNGK
ncbi:MAG: hypothetical protein R3264_13290 [Anaerolineae bacterium]|nr:hypothetical protein [Anaerolineae bacterium]